MAIASVTLTGEIPEEDREIYQNLARLQKIHQQVFELRVLLPDKLVQPSQMAMDSRGKTAPQKVASYIRDAAATGSKSIKSFQAEYESDEIKALWQNAISVELSQGEDVWIHDYTKLDNKPIPGAGRVVQAISASKPGPDSTGMDDEAILEKFANLHPDVKALRLKEGHVLPLEVDIDSTSLLLERTGSGEGAMLGVTLKNDKTAPPEAKEVLAQISDEGKSQGLGRVLSLIASYKGFKSQPCQKCGKAANSATTAASATADDAATTGGSTSTKDSTTKTSKGQSSSGTKTSKTQTTTSIDARLPAGGVEMISPAATDGSQYYKVGDYVTFQWNYTSLSVTPSAVDVLASCSLNSATYTISTNMSVEETGQVVWDTGNTATMSNPFPVATYTLIIYDAAKDPTDTASAGYLSAYDQYTFGMYTGQPYVPLNEFRCATCNGALSMHERQLLGVVGVTALVTILSFTWFANGFGLFR
ncbi:hypothetical protein DV737_g3284, partial [Chaetothyriales sp. CBS 132003]